MNIERLNKENLARVVSVGFFALTSGCTVTSSAQLEKSSPHTISENTIESDSKTAALGFWRLTRISDSMFVAIDTRSDTGTEAYRAIDFMRSQGCKIEGFPERNDSVINIKVSNPEDCLREIK